MNSPGRSSAAAEPASLPEPASPPASPPAGDGEDWHDQEAADTESEQDPNTACNEANPQEEVEADLWADSSDSESNPI